MSMAGFLSLVVAALTIASGFVGWRLHSWSRRWRRGPLVLWLSLAGFVALETAAPLTYRAYGAAAQALQWAAYLLMGWMAMVLFLLLVRDLVRWIGWLLSAAARVMPAFVAPARAIDPARRVFLSVAAPGTLIGASSALAGIGLVQARMDPTVREVDVPVRGLHADLEGLVIAQVSDLHVGQTIGRDFVERVSAITAAIKPDLVALTGDFVDGSPEELLPALQSLGKIPSPLGTYFIPGNHEYYWGIDRWLAAFEGLGATVLHNRHVRLTRGRAAFTLAGTADYAARRFEKPLPDVGAALAGAGATDLCIVLAHQPKAVFDVEKHPVDLQLSGHTHAGQFIPWSWFVGLAHPYTRDLNRHSERLWVYVNSGTGYWGPPNRFGVPSEITKLRLVKA